MSKQLRIVTATLRYAAFTETDQKAIDFIYQAKDDWQFADDGATVEVVTSLDSRMIGLPKDELVYHESMASGFDKTIEEAFAESPKESPRALTPAPMEQEVLDF